MSENNTYLTVNEVCEILRVKENTLRCWRNENRGPAFIKTGAKGTRTRVLYPRDALDKWLHANTVTPKNH